MGEPGTFRGLPDELYPDHGQPFRNPVSVEWPGAIAGAQPSKVGSRADACFLDPIYLLLPVSSGSASLIES
jgi:hypothetical protein